MAVFKTARIAAGMIGFAVILCQVAACAIGTEDGAIQLPKEAVARKILDNGLAILTKNSPPRGLVAIDVKILAGSSLEGEYLGSGISHLVEHMVFKGTKTRGPGEIEREIKSYGGIINGSTSRDITSYYVLLPSEHFSKGLEIIKDMLSGAAFDAAELQREKDVVLKEINLDEDDPQSRLTKRLNETAYIRHPYKYPPIGYASRLKTLARDDVVKYYNLMYAPNRMVVSIVGDVEASGALAEAEAVFKDFGTPNYAMVGPLPSEPAQLDIRRSDDDSRANLAYLAIGFHSTPILDEDLFAMDVLAMILGRGDNSRLNTSLLKENKLVYSISAWNDTPMEPGLFVISAILDGNNALQAESAIMDELSRLRDGLVSEGELGGARRMVLADFINSLETVDARANDIGLNYIMTGSPDFSSRYVEGVQKVSKEDVRRVANRYLKGSALTVARLIPRHAEDKKPGQEVAVREYAITKEVLPNGLRVLLDRQDKTPSVAITLAMLGGLMAESESDNGISNLTAHMLLKGTASRKEDQIEGRIEQLGGSVRAYGDISSFGLRLNVLKGDLPDALDILQDVLSNSVFPQDELVKERALTLAAIKEEDDDIFAAGFNALRKEVFGPSPYGLRYIGKEDTVASIDRDSLKSFYTTYVVPNNMVLSVSGDVDIQRTLSMIKEKFSRLTRRDLNIPIPEGQRLAKAMARQIHMDKQQSLILLGFETTSAQGDDRYALEVLGSALSGYSGRLFDRIRNRLGIAYTLGCAQKFGMGRGYFAFYVATTKDKLASARKTLIDEILRVRQNGITDEELALSKNELLVSRRVARQANGFNSFTTALDELYGLGYDNIGRYDLRINSVTKDAVKAVAQKYFNPEACAEVTVSPE